MNQDIIGRGWPFPVRPGPDGRLRLVGGERKIQQSIWIILATAQHESALLVTRNTKDFPAADPGVHVPY